MARKGSRWQEVVFQYPEQLRADYRQGKVLRQWYENYQGHYLYDDKMLLSNQIPHDGPPPPGQGALGFGELYVGGQYIEAGYEVMWRYLRKENQRCYRKLCELLGGEEAVRFVAPDSEAGGRAPDLLVFHPETGRFRFVECKGKNEGFAPKQIERFIGIEEFLNRTTANHAGLLSEPNETRLFPPLGEGQWIHMARVVPVR
jgi:hypothetical protein